MKPEPIFKPGKRKGEMPPTVKADRRTSAGALAGLPVFLKEAKTSRKPNNDSLEQHADSVAEAVTSQTAAFENTSRAAAHSSTATAIPTADAGIPLTGSIRNRIEPVLGIDLSNVRVHEAESDRAAAGSMNVRAFTHGQHIWMGPRESSSDLALMAHEAAHVAQQDAGLQTPLMQKQTNPVAPVTGTTDQLEFFVENPTLEKDSSVRTVLTMLSQYKPTVDVSAVDFRVMDVTQSYVGVGLLETGRSHWEGNKPIIELTQDKYDAVAKYLAGTGSVSDVHEVIRTVGHEMYHLYRTKINNPSNPIQPLFDAESAKRMDQIRHNWLEWAKDPGGQKALGIPKGTTVTKWEDIPAAERKKIEEGAAQTSQIQGLYERTAYLVEETYVRIEELSYLRVQQAAESGPKKPSQASVSDVANLIYRLNTALNQSVGNVDFMTPELLEKTKAAMLSFLRNRYPYRADPSVDSYEVIFYLAARESGLAPIYNDSGALISVVPPGARVK